MAKSFTLQLLNPDIKTAPQNVIDTGKSGGNKLNLILTNNFGFDLQFGGANQNLLFVKFSKNVFDDTNFALTTAVSPWTVDGIYTPADDPDKTDNQNYYVLRLKPPAAGVTFPDGNSITVSLAGVNPTAKGNATVFASYAFDHTTMNPSSQLAVLGSDKPGDKPLLGSENALLLTMIVNGGGPTNPIVVTDKPVTQANAAENKIHLNFDFQEHNIPPPSQNLQTLGNLVPAWDPNNPPTFRIEFPYFNANSQFPAPLNLTDDIKQGGQDYNEYTSAWNIKLSLSADDPTVTNNGWWTITPDPQSPSPSWLVQPTAANKYLFTGTTTGPTGSGPFLDLFFSHVYSALTLDPSRPETLIFLETYDFPGFGDSYTQYPLFKEKSVQINSFGGQIKFIAGNAQLVLDWDTNADHCFVSGDSQQQAASTDGAAYTRNITVTQPLASSYTLQAVGKDGVSKLRRTIKVQWKEASAALASAGFMYPTAVDVSPDGASVYVAGTPDGMPPPAVLSILDGRTLVSSASQVSPPNGVGIMNVKASPDGSKLFLAGLAEDGSTGYVLGYTTAAVPAPLPAAPPEPGFNSSVNLYPMAVSPDGTQIVISAPFTSGTDPFLAGYNVSDFKPSTGSPFAFPDHTGGNQLGPIGLAISGGTMFYPTFLGLGVMDRTTFQPAANSPISLKSDDMVSYTPGPLAVSPDGKTVTTLARGYINKQSAFILCRVDIPSMSLTKRVQVNNGYPNDYWTPTTALAYSVDGKYLFVFGMNYTPPAADPPTTTLLSVFDAGSLQELSWSPISVTKFYVDMVMAPDGSRIYVATLDNADGQSGSVRELIPYFA